jgi:hypothetical protein
MRIEYEKDGGFAYFPGLHRPVTIDTDGLSAEEAKEIKRLIEAAGFFDLPASSPPPRGAADYFQYTISVTAPQYRHTVRLTDPIRDPNVQALVNYLNEKAGE